jgi:hypothetical protein
MEKSQLKIVIPIVVAVILLKICLVGFFAFRANKQTLERMREIREQNTSYDDVLYKQDSIWQDMQQMQDSLYAEQAEYQQE